MKPQISPQITGNWFHLTFKCSFILTPRPRLPHMLSFHRQDCGWTLARDVFAVEFSASIRPLPLQSVHDQIFFSAAASVTPVTLSWDFGDLSSRVNATGAGTATAAHKYGLPGRYAVSLMAWVGHKEVSCKIFHIYASVS